MTTIINAADNSGIATKRAFVFIKHDTWHNIILTPDQGKQIYTSYHVLFSYLNN